MSYDNLSNEALLRLAWNKGGKAIDAAYVRFAPLVLLSAGRLLDAHDAQEVCSTVMSKLLATPQASRPDINNVAGYLYIMARNTSLKLLRAKSQRRAASELYAAQLFPDLHVESYEQTDLLGEETRQQYQPLYTAINQLSPSQRECLTLFYFGQYTYRDIARITDRTAMQVKSALQNGKVRLYKLLKNNTN